MCAREIKLYAREYSWGVEGSGMGLGLWYMVNFMGNYSFQRISVVNPGVSCGQKPGFDNANDPEFVAA